METADRFIKYSITLKRYHGDIESRVWVTKYKPSSIAELNLIDLSYNNSVFYKITETPTREDNKYNFTKFERYIIRQIISGEIEDISVLQYLPRNISKHKRGKMAMKLKITLILQRIALMKLWIMN
jgi:hypothetical protein